MNRYIYLILILQFVCLKCKTEVEKFKSDSNILNKTDDTYKAEILKILKLSDMEILRSLFLSNGMEIFLIKGTVKTDYYEETNLYIYPADTCSYFNKLMNLKFSMPGKLYDIENKLIYKAKLFYRSYKDNKVPMIIWYQHELSKDSSFIPSVFEIKFTEKEIQFNTITNNKEIDEIMKKISSGGFTEIEGEVNYEEP